MNPLYTVEGFRIDDLEHSGVKGQKWGIRRYQNPDGSLTELGRKRYGYNAIDKKDAKIARKKAAGKNVEKQERRQRIRRELTDKLVENDKKIFDNYGIDRTSNRKIIKSTNFVGTMFGGPIAGSVASGVAMAVVRRELNSKSRGKYNQILSVNDKVPMSMVMGYDYRQRKGKDVSIYEQI